MASFDLHHRRQLHRGSSSAAPTSSKQPKLHSSPPSIRHPYPQININPNASGNAEGKDHNSASSSAAVDANLRQPMIVPAPEDVYLSNSSHLTRQEVLRRRSHNLKQLARVYKDYYWAAMETLKVEHKEYVSKYGASPYEEVEDRENAEVKAAGDVVEGSGVKGLAQAVNSECAFSGCPLKAMALTRFCHLHILSDPKQVLYKPCEYVIKSAQVGPITCGKPILRARVPPFCNVHLQKTIRAQKKAGLHISSSSNLAPKFHVIVAEYVRQIQVKRRDALRESRNNVVVKQESCN